MRTILICLPLLAALWPLCAFGDEGPIVPTYDPPFIISYFLGPPKDELTIERYQEIADCGFNVAQTVWMISGGASEADNKKVLDFCREVGLKVIVWDRRVWDRRTMPHKSDGLAFAKNLDAVVASYSRHPALTGYMLTDEPCAKQFSELSAVTHGLLKRDPERLPFVNLLPNYADKRQMGTDDYEEYVRRYIETVKPKLVSWDHYALMRNGERPSYFENLEIVSRLCREARLPFVQTILSVPHGGYRNPSEADLRWQVYTSLCYGAKGILYFTYWTDTVSKGGYHNAIIDENKHRSEKYAFIRKLNRKMKMLAPTLLKLQGLRVAHTEPIPPEASGLDKHFPVAKAEGGPLALGWLHDGQRRDYLFVVNRSFTEPSEPFLVFLREKVRQVVEISQDSGLPIKADFDSATSLLTVPLQAGEGRLFRFDGC